MGSAPSPTLVVSPRRMVSFPPNRASPLRKTCASGIARKPTDTADAAENVQPRLHSVRLTERSSAVGKSLGEIALGNSVEVTSVRRRGARSEVPQPEYRFEAGDILVLLGRPEGLALAEKKLLRG